MPRLDSQGDVISRITGIDKGPIPQMSNTPIYLAIRGMTSVGEREVLLSVEAARDLQERLQKLLPPEDAE
jgi:hypothetical protein